MRDRHLGRILGRRRSLPRTAIFVAVLLIIWGAGAYLLAQPSAGRHVTYGFNDPAGPPSYRLQAELGAPIRRMLVGWNQVQPADGTWNWAQSDAAYAALMKAHLRPLLVALAPPCWAHPSTPCSGVDLGVTPQDPGFDGAWAEFISRLTARYPSAVGLEVWNEENLAPPSAPSPVPARYAQLLEEAYRAVKGVNPAIPVISGGLFASPVSGPDGISDTTFLRQIYAAGARGSMDGIGIHLYPMARDPRSDVAAMQRVLNALRVVRDAARDGSTPIWVTEVGVSTRLVTGPEQAADLVAIVNRLHGEADVPVVIIQRLIDPSASATNPYGGSEPGYGVFSAHGSPKPAACALSVRLHGKLRC